MYCIYSYIFKAVLNLLVTALSKGCPKKCNNRFCVKMGLPMENSYKTDPPITIPEFSENNFENNFFWKNQPKKSKNTPKIYKMSNNMVKEGSKIFLTVFLPPQMWSFSYRNHFDFLKKLKKNYPKNQNSKIIIFRILGNFNGLI